MFPETETHILFFAKKLLIYLQLNLTHVPMTPFRQETKEAYSTAPANDMYRIPLHCSFTLNEWNFAIN